MAELHVCVMSHLKAVDLCALSMTDSMVPCVCPAVRFNRGKPFKPFEQLLAVLPAASASLLPHPFQWLMTDARSPVLDFYPDKFDIDMEGKRAEWEGIVKVPFIDEQRLLAAAASVPLGRWVLGLLAVIAEQLRPCTSWEACIVWVITVKLTGDCSCTRPACFAAQAVDAWPIWWSMRCQPTLCTCMFNNVVDPLSYSWLSLLLLLLAAA